MDKNTLLAAMKFSYDRLNGVLTGIEKSGQDVTKVLGWRPGPGRAHIGWQAMHCAATIDRYVNTRLRETDLADPQIVADFAGGSTPSDDNVPTLADIRLKLQEQHDNFDDFVNQSTPEELARSMDFPNNIKRTVAESLVLLTWHEAHHQGQIHLTWNLYKAANGL